MLLLLVVVVALSENFEMMKLNYLLSRFVGDSAWLVHVVMPQVEYVVGESRVLLFVLLLSLAKLDTMACHDQPAENKTSRSWKIVKNLLSLAVKKVF